MRVLIGAVLAALAVSAATARAPAQMPSTPACESHQAGLGGVGRAETVSFTGAVGRERVCALVANLSAGAVSARIVDGARGGDPLVVAAITPGGGAVLGVRDGALAVEAAPPGTRQGGDSVAIGPFVVTPGGRRGFCAPAARAAGGRLGLAAGVRTGCLPGRDQGDPHIRG